MEVTGSIALRGTQLESRTETDDKNRLVKSKREDNVAFDYLSTAVAEGNTTNRAEDERDRLSSLRDDSLCNGRLAGSMVLAAIWKALIPAVVQSVRLSFFSGTVYKMISYNILAIYLIREEHNTISYIIIITERSVQCV